MPVPITCHGLSGTTLGIMGSFVLVLPSVHLWHCFTRSSIWRLRPGHHSACFALSWHFVTPWWPLWMRSSISSLMDVGMTILSALRSNPCMDSQEFILDLFCRYGLRASGTLVWSGHPSLQYPFSVRQTSSSSCFFSYSPKPKVLWTKDWDQRLVICYYMELFCNKVVCLSLTSSCSCKSLFFNMGVSPFSRSKCSRYENHWLPLPITLFLGQDRTQGIRRCISRQC